MSAALALPGVLGRFATEVAHNHAMPVDAVAVLSLGVLSAATRGRWRVQVRPGWTESLALYTAAVAEPAGRSPLLAELAAPIKELERALAVEPLGGRRPTRLWFEDATPEGLVALLARQGGASACLGDGDLLKGVAGRRSAQAGIDVLLKAYNGDRLRVDRAGRPNIELIDLFLAIAIVADPVTMGRVVRVSGGLVPSLLARFLFAVAPSGVPTSTRPTEVSVWGIDSAVSGTWDAAVSELLDVALAGPVGGELAMATLPLAPQALARFEAFAASWEPRLHPETGDPAALGAWAARLPGQLPRIAALLALADDPGRTDVGAEHVEAAVALAEPLAVHARAALAVAA